MLTVSVCVCLRFVGAAIVVALIVALTVCYVCKKKSSGPLILQSQPVVVHEGIAMSSAVVHNSKSFEDNDMDEKI